MRSHKLENMPTQLGTQRYSVLACILARDRGVLGSRSQDPDIACHCSLITKAAVSAITPHLPLRWAGGIDRGDIRAN